MSKWFDQYCKLNRLDKDMILDQIYPYAKKYNDGYYADIYTSVVYDIPLSVENIDDLMDRFNSSRDKRPVKRLLDKLELLRSQL
jgi:hypothetical protein